MQNNVHASRPAAVSPTVLVTRHASPTERLLHRVEPHAGRFLRLGIPAAAMTRPRSASSLAYEVA
jgi:hypothetical protein